MSGQRLTPWFPIAVAPARVGVYRTRENGRSGSYFSYFDGARWHGEWISADRAAKNKYWANGQDMTHWRGLATCSEGAE